ncbi:hypothetical protein [Chitinophaga arvensicola]|uniref:Uncharacterized protein n=1 Tax=Chitinophaga arvensicola TaxID=29529 RepID=A0A1I0QKR3_9BACT|nr:hypothetical protein [Chitinophaga arvensicola]SEW27286.1 hypothetical protein SAMN04488122_1517 [Chitinophaga arvensicola]
MKRMIGPQPDNILGEIYSKLLALSCNFREKVEEECGWSTPTFYRKQRLITGLSNAEKEKIAEIFADVITGIAESQDKYRRANW